MTYNIAIRVGEHDPVARADMNRRTIQASAVQEVLADLCEAIAAEVDLDACGLRLGRALDAARFILDSASELADPE